MDESTAYRQWISPTPKAVFLLIHGLGAYTERWEMLGQFFRQKGISSYSPELQDFHTYDKDILNIYHLAVKENPGKSIFLVGESLGALISFWFAVDNPDMFSGLVCLSPAFANRISLPVSDYIKIFFSLFYDRQKKIRVPFDSSMCTRDVEYRKKMDADSREKRSASAIVLTKIMVLQALLPIVKNRLNIPVLFLSAGEDKIVDEEKTREVFESLSVKDKTMIEYPEMYHSLSIELGKERIFEDLLKWVDKRI